MYSPAFGQLGIESGFIENMRFYGNIVPGFDNQDNEPGQRIFSKDKGQDAISRLIITLFPSNGGVLSPHAQTTDNFSQYITTPKLASFLFNYAASCRSNVCADEPIKRSFKEALKEARASSSSIKRFGSILNGVLAEIASSVAEDKRGESPYPHHITELVLSSFFFEKFNNQNDIFELLRNLDEDIIDKSKLPAVDQEPDLLTVADVEQIAQKDPETLTLDEIVALNNGSIFTAVTPYKPGVSLVSNAAACAYDRRAQQILSKQMFADCVEMAGRHLMNLLLYNPLRKDFDLSHLDKRFRDDLKEAHPFYNFRSFYELQKPDLANSGDPFMRSEWNQVVGDLGFGEQVAAGILYCKSIGGTCAFELKSGYIKELELGNYSSVRSIHLKNLSELEVLDLRHTRYLENLFLLQLPSLKELKLGDSLMSLEKIDDQGGILQTRGFVIEK